MIEEEKDKKFQGLIALGIIWLLGALCDRLWFALDHSTPAWDQAEYLTGTLNYGQALRNPQIFSGEWWVNFWQISSKIPPLVYILAGFVQNVFGNGPDRATIINLFFSAILLISVYGLGVYLFSVEVGLLAAVICQLLPGLYRVRLDFLLDYPLTAVVTFSFFCLTVWRFLGTAETQRTQRKEWFWAVIFGLSLGVSLMVKQTALFFLLIPILWVLVATIRQKKWERLAQLFTAFLVSVLVFGFWYRINWLLILTSGKRATVDSAIAEGDPPLNTLAAWTFYWQDLPYVVSWVLLLVPIVGLLIYYFKSKSKNPKAKVLNPYLGWLVVFWIGSYLLCSLNINKDTRYVLPYLPVLAVFLAYCLTLWQGRFAKSIRWGTIGLAFLLMLCNLYPLGGAWLTQFLSPRFQHYIYTGAQWPQREVIAEITQTEPYLRSNLGVLPSTPNLNQHNFNYFGALQNFQVYGRQVGTRKKFVLQDVRSLSWFVTKTGDQGSVPSEAQSQITQIVEQGKDFKLQKSWKLPDGSNLNLYRSKQPPVIVQPLAKPLGKVSLNKVTVPEKVAPGTPVTVVYDWSGSWEQLQSGIVLLTWYNSATPNQRINNQSRWVHDHGFGMGNLYPPNLSNNASKGFRVVEKMAMLPPAELTPGNYTLFATYLNRQTGENYPIKTPKVTVIIEPNASKIPAPELDLITQLRTLAISLPEGPKALDRVFEQIGRINQYDPTQDYLQQAEISLKFRLKREPSNWEFAYNLALTKVLQRDVKGAIAALQTVTQLDSQNPYAYAYLAFVHLYNWNPKAAQTALQPALAIDPNSPELQALSGVASAMQGNLIKAWRQLQPILNSNSSK
ncbi:phospholipid carrier-dependent glycosyltransferase [[Phormidium] sp. LEGE 05292]|uniref:phospholipid carrier-dependent glycosyltransferase n=1 Tax=[Phormidium] sp. LEGE 05292 TaxID=767427 RepID=UPI002AD49B62|nr:phospholipid carrier-dependent glycosyltransferase [Phormidium sp. LEGE 05292]